MDSKHSVDGDKTMQTTKNEEIREETRNGETIQNFQKRGEMHSFIKTEMKKNFFS